MEKAINHGNVLGTVGEVSFAIAERDNLPKTIAEALLTCGAMDLEELEAYAEDNKFIKYLK